MSRSHPPRSTGAADAQRALDALRCIVGALRSSSRTAVREAGVTGAQLFVLQQVASAPGESIGALARRTHTRQNTVSDVVRRLVRQGLLTRVPSPHDGRRAVLDLTDAGHAVVERAPRTLQARLVEGLARLPAVQRRALADGLEAWLEAAELETVPAAMFFERRAGHRAARDVRRERGAR